jgi:putative metallohydrolase (TIGR04338 family)
VTRKFWGMPMDIDDPVTLVREMKLGTGRNPTSAARPRRYHQDEGAARVYRAEQALRAHYEALDPTQERWFADVAEVQQYVDTIISWPWDRWLPWPCQVRVTDQPVPDYRSGIYMCRNAKAWRELVVLHELGHHFAKQQPANMDHGGLFLAAFTDLLADVMGLDVRERFRECLRAEGVSA